MRIKNQNGWRLSPGPLSPYGRWPLVALCALALGGCERTTPVQRAGTVTRSGSLTSTSECPAGGVALDYGIDTNGNGALESDEVDGTHVICHGAPGTTRYTGLTDTPDLSVYVTTSSLAPVATSGSYQDLSDAPSEMDPEVGALVAGKWCLSDGVRLNCDVDPPTIDYSLFDGVIRACDGHGTQTFDADTAQWGPCFSGFFVLSSTVFDGNLGGLAGADAACLADLQNNAWLGSARVTLDASRVRAFLCTTSTCNNLTPDKGYTFAVSGAPGVGGASFVTSASGTGPLNPERWDSPRHFGIATPYFSNRGSLAAHEWSTLPDPEPPPGGHPVGSLQCANWTNGTAGLGNWESVGFSGAGNASRWYASGAHNYCGDRRLICLVNP